MRGTTSISRSPPRDATRWRPWARSSARCWAEDAATLNQRTGSASVLWSSCVAMLAVGLADPHLEYLACCHPLACLVLRNYSCPEIPRKNRACPCRAHAAADGEDALGRVH